MLREKGEDSQSATTEANPAKVMWVRGTPHGQLAADLLEAGFDGWLDDLRLRCRVYYPHYDDIIEEISGMFSRGEEFQFDPNMTTIYPSSYLPEGCFGKPERHPIEKLQLVNDTIHRQWTENVLRVLETARPEVPDELAGRYCVFLGIWPFKRGGVRYVHFDVPDESTKRGFRKRRMTGRWFLLWARQVPERWK